MNLFDDVLMFVRDQLAAMNPAWPLDRVTVEVPKDPTHGEMATNAAMVLAKEAGMNPRALAEAIAEKLRAHPRIAEVTLAGPGFINLKFKPEFWRALLADVLSAGIKFGANAPKSLEKINVEYVSANPTGPLHAGHMRGAVLGDALCNLLLFYGHDVTKEYYLNDYGNQVNILAQSVHLRYREALGETIEIPEGCYPGDYLVPVGQALAARDGGRWLNAPEAEWLPVFREYGIEAMMELIRADLATIEVKHDVITSERKLVEDGAVQKTFDYLQQHNDIYFGQLEPPKGELPEDWEPREQWLFRSTEYGDDVDRPLKKSDGSWTYFASDVANHYDKYLRGALKMVTAVGADHAGYVKRMEAATRAVTDRKGELKVLVYQMVRMLDNGQIVRLSKRAGNIILLSDVVERVGKDVVRLIMLTRKPDQIIDFDFAKVTEQSKDNPVFYIQYAHARVCSVLRHAAEILPDMKTDDIALAAADMTLLETDAEIAMIRKLAEWPRMVAIAAQHREPHRIAFYLQEVAAELHSLWTAGKDDTTLRFILPDDAKKTAARLALLRSAALVIAAGLGIIGVAPAEQM
ncbi:MAG TPA: arginine--tRNA ligase [Alphaproteobacteria bacterium]|nr:arginine--tRNA ligase [Alphaproteobacteria bacterium]